MSLANKNNTNRTKRDAIEIKTNLLMQKVLNFKKVILIFI